MKNFIKIISAFLIITLTLFFIIGCGKNDDSKAEVSDKNLPAYNYDDVIAQFKKYVEFISDWDNAEVELHNINVFPEPNKNSCARGYIGDWAYMLAAIRLSTRGRLGYAIKDTNSNGEDELFLLSDVGEVIVIFGMYEGQLNLMIVSGERSHIYITKDWHIITVDGGAGTVIRKYRISQSDWGLVFVDGISSQASITEPYSRLLSEDYYDTVPLTEEEYNKLYQEIWPGGYKEVKDCSEYGLEFIPLFEE